MYEKSNGNPSKEDFVEKPRNANRELRSAENIAKRNADRINKTRLARQQSRKNKTYSEQQTNRQLNKLQDKHTPEINKRKS